MAALSTIVLQLSPIFIGTLILLKILQLVKRKYELTKSFREFPGPKPHWLYGNMREVSGDLDGLLRTADYGAIYKGVFPVWMGPLDAYLNMAHPTIVKHVFSGSDPKDEFSYALMRPWIGDGLLLAGGRKWDRNRRMLTPAFHMDILKHYVKIFNESTKVLVQKWRENPGCVETFHHMSLLTLDSMMKCLFGHQSNCQLETVRPAYIQCVYDVSDLIIKRIMNPIHHYGFLYSLSDNGRKFKYACDTIHDHSNMLIGERRKLLEKEKPGSRNIDFLDILLSAKDSDGCGLSEQEIRDEVDTFMFAGHDSTASTLSWCLYNLALHPEYQDQCREEVQREWGDNTDLTWEDIHKLSFTFSCIKESQRLFPPVPNVSRCAEKNITLPDGRIIPKGMRMAVSLFALHRNPDVWSNPEEFDPYRFSEENTKTNAGSGNFIPFSLGPRNCIGQAFATTQLKVVVPMIVRNFRLTLDPSRPAEPEAMLILRSKNGLYLNITPL
ncbi:cytochrome P450 4F12-like [Argopecten irradians]|uniref:cytochrome P450 4F12-like n=1 Tax=Argopecten irradians TaxID=31199 RepID=UPI003717140A